MLVNKYKRIDSDDEDERQKTGSPTTGRVTASEGASGEKEAATNSTPAFVTSKALSVAPAIPEYKMGVRHSRYRQN